MRKLIASEWVSLAQRVHLKTRRTIPFVIGAGLLHSACSDNRSQERSASDSPSTAQEDVSPESAPAGEIDPCTLVTPAEAAEALGVANVGLERPAAANTPLRLGTCLYSAEVGQGLAVMNVMVRYGYSLAEASVGFEGMRETYAETSGVVDVPDLGEQAFWIGDLSQLWVLKGIIQLGVSGDIPLEKARVLAGTAVERLE